MRALALILWVLAAPATAEPFFGYVGVSCGVDDPWDDSGMTDYGLEVAGWTSANHLCLTGEVADWPARLRAADALWRPILSVEPAFDFDGQGPDGAAAQVIWGAVRQAVLQSGVDPARIIFYLVDEPALRGIDPAYVEAAATRIRTDFPASGVMVIEAYHGEALPPPAPSVTLWGFDAYTIRDPLAEPLYTEYLARVQAALEPGQKLVLVLDAQHTPTHLAEGLTEDDMAEVAANYGRLAATLPDLGGVIGYTWTGGIDGPEEKGLRDLPPAVIEAHRTLAAQVLGR